MSDENSSLSGLGRKAASKAVEESIKGISKFFGKICMPAAEEFGLLLRDRVTLFRLKNLENIVNKAKKRIGDNEVSISGDTDPRIIKEIIEEGSWASDDAIQSMWAGLISASAQDGKSNNDCLIYVDLLKRLTPFQARLINGI